MSLAPPPPLLGSARVVAYAVTSGGAHIAIGINLAANEVRLFRCNDQWAVLYSSAHESLDEAKAQAAADFQDIEWRVAQFDLSDLFAEGAEDPVPVCSFCGRKASDATKMVTSRGGAAICNLCVREMHQRLHSET